MTQDPQKRCVCGSTSFVSGFGSHENPSLLWVPLTGQHWLTHATKSLEVTSTEHCSRCAKRRNTRKMAGVIPGPVFYDALAEELVIPVRRLVGPTTWRFEFIFEDGITRFMRDAFDGGAPSGLVPEDPPGEMEPGPSDGTADETLRADVSGFAGGKYDVLLRNRYGRGVHACGSLTIEELQN